MPLIKPESARGFTRLPALQQVGLLVGLAICIAVGIAAGLWSQRPNYSLLYARLPDQEAADVLDALQRLGIRYRIEPATGGIMVPSGEVHAARVKLAGEGLPKAAEQGLELLRRDQELGASQFVQQARYHHALEVELGRSIASLRNVAGARVHLAIPKPSVFLRRNEPPSASVVVNLHPGRNLEEGQVAAIVHLVASSIANLSPDRITVVDQTGRLLTRRDADPDLALTASQFEYTREVEEAYIQRIESLLTPVLGATGVRAQVKASLDFTRTEQAREQYDPEGKVLRSEQLYEERQSGDRIAGVPGALTNQPPEGGTLDPRPGAGDGTGEGLADPGSRSSRSTRNYELDRTLTHSRAPGGRITRLSVAVVVDDRIQVTKSGAVERVPLTAAELDTITALVKDAVGFDAARGDTLSVINQAFQQPPPEQPVAPEPWWQQSWLLDLGRMLVGGAVIVLLILGALRPALNRLAVLGARPAPPALPPGGGALDEERLSLSDARAPQSPGPAPALTGDRLAAARQVAGADPARVAQVVRTWVEGDG